MMAAVRMRRKRGSRAGQVGQGETIGSPELINQRLRCDRTLAAQASTRGEAFHSNPGRRFFVCANSRSLAASALVGNCAVRPSMVASAKLGCNSRACDGSGFCGGQFKKRES